MNLTNISIIILFILIQSNFFQLFEAVKSEDEEDVHTKLLEKEPEKKERGIKGKFASVIKTVLLSYKERKAINSVKKSLNEFNVLLKRSEGEANLPERSEGEANLPETDSDRILKFLFALFAQLESQLLHMDKEHKIEAKRELPIFVKFLAKLDIRHVPSKFIAILNEEHQGNKKFEDFWEAIEKEVENNGTEKDEWNEHIGIGQQNEADKQLNDNKKFLLNPYSQSARF